MRRPGRYERPNARRESGGVNGSSGSNGPSRSNSSSRRGNDEYGQPDALPDSRWARFDRKPSLETSGARRASLDQDRRATRGGPPLPTGPPGSNWQSSQSSLNGASEAGPSTWNSAASSFRGTPPRFSGGRGRGSSISQQRGAWDRERRRDADEPGYPDANGPEDIRKEAESSRRSLTPPPRRDLGKGRERSPDEDGRRGSIVSSRSIPGYDDERSWQRSADQRAADPFAQRRDPVWSDNRRSARPSPRWEPPPSVIGKRPRYQAEMFERPQDRGWGSRPARSESISYRPDRLQWSPVGLRRTYAPSKPASLPGDTDNGYDRGDRSPGQISSSNEGTPPPGQQRESSQAPPSWKSPVPGSRELPTKREPDIDVEPHSNPLAARISRDGRNDAPTSTIAQAEPVSLRAEPPRPPTGPRAQRAVSASQSLRAGQKPASAHSPPAPLQRRLSGNSGARTLSSDPRADAQSPRSLRERLGPPPVQLPSGPPSAIATASTTPTRPRAMSQQAQSSPTATARREAVMPSPRRTFLPSPVAIPAATPIQAVAPLESSSRHTAFNQLRRSPSPVRTENSDISSGSSNPPIRQEVPQEKPTNPINSSPKLENQRPLVNGSFSSEGIQSQKPSVSPRPLAESRESQSESLRAPPPLRTRTQDQPVVPPNHIPLVMKVEEQVEVVMTGTLASPTTDADLSAETVIVETSMQVESLRPSSPLSDLPHSQPLADDMDVVQPDAEIEAEAGAEAEGGELLDDEMGDFDKTLQCFIEEEESAELDTIDVEAIVEENRFKAPKELPLQIEPREEDDDPFSFDQDNLDQYAVLEPFLLEQMRAEDERRGVKIFKLRQQYKELDQEWQVHCAKLEKIRDRHQKRHQAVAPPLTPAIDASGLPFVAAPATPSMLAPSGRANRRNAAASLGYGDAVRSEAEFLEILARLEDADMADPNLRAMRTTATVPDMVIDPSERALLVADSYADENGLVLDPVEHYGINKVPDDWTEEEIAIFCRRYASHPKQFGKIAASLPNKTIPQCVLFYYRSKKKIDFRALVDKRSRDGKRKKGKKGEAEEEAPGVKKGPSLLGNLKRSRVEEDDDDDDDDEPQTPGSAIARESAVLSTAKALTRQLHGATSDDAAAFAEAAVALSQPPRMPVSRQPSGNKKAARFLSPPLGGADGMDGIAPASDGALAAAEVLGGLAGALEPLPSSGRLAGGKKKRKPSISEPNFDGSYEEGTPRSAGSNKRARAITSSYWSVADKNEFVRLLGVHGKNWTAISGGIESKTAVQCKNFFQNNTKKMGLAEVAAQADDETGGSAATSGVIVEEMELPSVFAEAQAEKQPASGYFDSLHYPKHAKPATYGGGMHLRNLLDDAPDAEGGAVHHDDFSTPPVPPEVMGAVNGDSSTEDEAYPARYAAPLRQNGTHHRRVVSHGSVRLETGTAPQIQHLPQGREYIHPESASLYGSRNGHAPYHGRTVYVDSRLSPEYGTRDMVSPLYVESLPTAYRPHHGLPPPSGRLVYPSARQWSPHESRTIYSAAAPVPVGVPYYRPVERRNSEDLGHVARPSPPLRSSAFFRRSQGDVVKGLPPPGTTIYSQSPIYDAPQHAYYAHPHLSHLQHQSTLRASEASEPGSPYYSAGSYSHLSRSR